MPCSSVHFCSWLWFCASKNDAGLEPLCHPVRRQAGSGAAASDKYSFCAERLLVVTVRLCAKGSFRFASAQNWNANVNRWACCKRPMSL